MPQCVGFNSLSIDSPPCLYIVFSNASLLAIFFWQYSPKKYRTNIKIN